VNPASLGSVTPCCHACGTSGVKLLLCGRCQNAWFCNRQCQVVARKELGPRGAHCRSAEEAPRSSSLACPEVTPVDLARLDQSCTDLLQEARVEIMQNTRIGNLAVVEKCQAAAAVADRMGGWSEPIGVQMQTIFSLTA